MLRQAKRLFEANRWNLLLAFIFVGLVSMSGCVEAKSGGQNLDLKRIESGITTDVVPGMPLTAAKDVMKAKYGATLTEEKSDVLSYTIQDKPDKAGVYGILIISIAHEQGRVTSVRFDLGGMGP